MHRDALTVFSNLDHGLNGGHGAVQGFLTSIKKEEAAGFPEKNISLDQAAAEFVGSKTRFSFDQHGHRTWYGHVLDACWRPRATNQQSCDALSGSLCESAAE